MHEGKEDGGEGNEQKKEIMLEEEEEEEGEEDVLEVEPVSITVSAQERVPQHSASSFARERTIFDAMSLLLAQLAREATLDFASERRGEGEWRMIEREQSGRESERERAGERVRERETRGRDEGGQKVKRGAEKHM
eukprot:746575-Hanusia_phi.AAC.2